MVFQEAKGRIFTVVVVSLSLSHFRFSVFAHFRFRLIFTPTSLRRRSRARESFVPVGLAAAVAVVDAVASVHCVHCNHCKSDGAVPSSFEDDRCDFGYSFSCLDSLERRRVLRAESERQKITNFTFFFLIQLRLSQDAKTKMIGKRNT